MDFSRGRRALRIYVHFGGHPHGRPACGSKALNDPPLSPRSPLKSSALIHAGIPGTFRGGGGHCIFTCILACIQMGGLLVEATLSNDPAPPHQKQGLDPSRGSWDFLWGRALHIYVHFGEHPHGRLACGSKAFKLSPPQKQGLDPSRDSEDFSRGRRALRIYVRFGGHPHGRPACGSKALNNPPSVPAPPSKAAL